MMLVFIPVSFMGGIYGVFYRQFGLTMAMSIGLSAINALTLSPALCALFLKPHKKEDEKPLKERIKDAYSAAGEVMKETYKKRFRLKLPPVITLVFITASIALLMMGWFDFENIMKGVIAVVVGIISAHRSFLKRIH